MSQDLGFFSVRKGVSAAEVRDVYLGSCAGEYVSWSSSASLEIFISKLEKKYPDLDSLSEEQVDSSPWACGFSKGTGFIIVSMSFSRAAEVGNYIWALLEENELIVFDPQADKAYIGNSELPETLEAKKWWQFWK
ncbi:MAG: hypothetical protein JXR18_02155 [Neptuniibacter sp.]